jgi:D-aminopeptidase
VPTAALAPAALGQQTTLAIVATDAPLDRERATVVGRMATAGMARTLYPAFTPFDGDLIFVVSTSADPVVGAAEVATVGDAAARVVARSIVRAVRR